MIFSIYKKSRAVFRAVERIFKELRMIIKVKKQAVIFALPLLSAFCCRLLPMRSGNENKRYEKHIGAKLRGRFSFIFKPRTVKVRHVDLDWNVLFD
jgi:hypothetical protein